MKDASATAIYGSAGANGVILITTKSGKSGKSEVSYNGYVSFSRLGKKLDLLGVEDYVRYQYEFRALRGNLDNFANIFGGSVSDPDFYTGADSRIAEMYRTRRGIDWQDEVFGKTGITRNHNVSITGGNERTNFMVSYNYTGEDGIMDRHNYSKKQRPRQTQPQDLRQHTLQLRHLTPVNHNRRRRIARRHTQADNPPAHHRRCALGPTTGCSTGPRRRIPRNARRNKL